jgi:hypothetical protein
MSLTCGHQRACCSSPGVTRDGEVRSYRSLIFLVVAYIVVSLLKFCMFFLSHFPLFSRPSQTLAFHIVNNARRSARITEYLKMAAFWDIESCSLVEIYGRFRCAYCFYHRPDDRGNQQLRNLGQFIRDYTVQYPKKLPSCHGTIPMTKCVYYFRCSRRF